MKRILLITLLSALATIAGAQNRTLGTLNSEHKTAGVHTFDGSTICFKEPSGSDKACLNAPALSGDVVLTLPATTGTLGLAGGSVAVGAITGLGTGVATWLGTPTGANLTTALSSGGGTANFLRADGTFASPAGGTGLGDFSGPASATDGAAVVFDGTTGKFGKNSKVVLTVPASAATITIASGKTLTVSNSPTIAGTDSTMTLFGSTTVPVFGQQITFTGPTAARTVTLPNSDFTVARTDAVQTFTGIQTFSVYPTVSTGITNGIVLSGAGGAQYDTSNFTWDNANLRLNIGAASTATRDLYLSKTVAGAVQLFVENLSNGTGSTTNIVAANDTGSVLIRKYSSTFTTAGLRVANAGSISNNTSGPLYFENLVATDTIFSSGGSAAANETFRVLNGGGWKLIERTAPAAPAANEVYVYAVDNGSGKTQLMALFSSGAAQQIAIQP